MARPWDEEAFDKEMREKLRNIKDNFRRLEREDKKVLKELEIPLWLKIGESLVRDGKYNAWKKFVRHEGKASRIYGAAIEQAIDVMVAIELDGIDAGIETYTHLDGQWFEVMQAVILFSRRGVEFANAFREQKPDWEISKKLTKFEGKTDPVVTEEEVKGATQSFGEVIEYLKQLQTLPLRTREDSIIKRRIEEFDMLEDKYQTNQNTNKNSVKR